MDNNVSFRFTYSAEQQKEIEQIRKNYLPPQEDKMAQLRKLHHSATQKAQIWAIILGILGTLVLGTGMSLCMTKLGDLFGAFGMLIGIVVGISGLVLVALAYPVYNRVLKQERRRIAPEILRLTDELMK